MKMSSSGKVITIFIVIFLMLLFSLTAISMFFLQQESKLRRDAEAKLGQTQAKLVSLSTEFEKVKSEKFVLEEKNKEADNRINDLSSELDLEKGLKEQMKTENASLKSQAEQEKVARKQLQDQLDQQLADFQKKSSNLEARLTEALKAAQEQESQAKAIDAENSSLKQKISTLEEGFAPATKPTSDSVKEAKQTIEKEQVQLDKIVVAPKEVPDGRILSVDAETEFVIINLGEKDGVKLGDLFSVYRGKDYLGDVKVTRLQPEMSAADLLPPFSSKLVRKNDQVISK